MKGIIHSKVRGVTFEGRQEIIRRVVRPGIRLDAIREPKNPHGANAIGLWAGREQIGHLSSDLAEELAPQMDAGHPLTVTVTDLTGNGPGESIGVNIVIDMQGENVATRRNEKSSVKRLSPARAVLLVVGLLVVTLICAAARNTAVVVVCLAIAAGLVWQWRRSGGHLF
jgi:hypothetical protein